MDLKCDISISGLVSEADGLGKIPLLLKKALATTDLNVSVENTLELDKIYHGRVHIGTSFLGTFRKKPPSDSANYAYAMYEATLVPPVWVESINNYYDGIIVPDKWVASSFVRSGVNVPIKVIPLPYEEVSKTTRNLNQEKQFVFGINAQYEFRKNHIDVVEAFLNLYKDNDMFKLKIHGKASTPRFLDYINNKYKKNENIEISCSVLSNEEYNDWWDSIDAYILCSKGEGFSITPREAILKGIPTIISNYSAHETLVDTGGVIGIEPNGTEPAYKDLFGCSFGEHATFDVKDISKGMAELVVNYTHYLNKNNLAKQYILENENDKIIGKLLGELALKTT